MLNDEKKRLVYLFIDTCIFAKSQEGLCHGVVDKRVFAERRRSMNNRGLHARKAISKRAEVRNPLRRLRGAIILMDASRALLPAPEHGNESISPHTRTLYPPSSLPRQKRSVSSLAPTPGRFCFFFLLPCVYLSSHRDADPSSSSESGRTRNSQSAIHTSNSISVFTLSSRARARRRR